MAKKSRDDDRKAMVEKMRHEQQRKERIRTWGVLGVCTVVVAGLLGVAGSVYVEDSNKRDTPLADIGVSTASAGCKAVQTEDASGSGQHVTAPEPITYQTAPPAFGRHWGNFLEGSEIKTFYTRDDVPEIERLVHSLEHGYSILWYDDAVKTSSPDYQALEALGHKLDASDKFIAAPYITSDDGGTFPHGTDFALTHWTGPDDQKGVWEYCSGVSGQVVDAFMGAYDKDDTPEPGGI